MNNISGQTLKVALAQQKPAFLDREAGLDKITRAIQEAAEQGAQLAVFGEALLPGYPFWLEHTDGARFESDEQKQLFAEYSAQAVQIEAGHLEPLKALCARLNMAVYLGIIERPAERGGHSLYCSLVYIDQDGEIRSVHRKLMPTYEERLVWSIGDGNGLRTHQLGAFTLGGLNCWENWMPLPRATLYAQGEDVHVAVWPGNLRNTVDITRMIARESRSYVISVSGLMQPGDFPEHISALAPLRALQQDYLADGGSCVAAPDGSWLLEPVTGEEAIFVVELNHDTIRAERQNFDPSGHYARADVFQLQVDRRRQRLLETKDS